MAKILCVEDEPDLLDDLAEELELAGHEVMQTSNGKEALEVILRDRPDLVISDACMPHMNGYELLAELRGKHQQFADMPFIFLSAYNYREDVIGGIKLGADDYLTKPVDYELLLAKIEASIRQSQRVRKQMEDDQARPQPVADRQDR
jgi:DNA-binding response OmpR family regulator